MNRNPDFDTSSQNKNLNNQKNVIPVVEEQIQVGKEVVETGAMRISKKVHEEEVTVNVPITYNEHDVERVAVNKFVDAPPPIRYEGNTMIIPILEEVVVLEKKLKVVEELRVTARQVQTSSAQQVTLLREEVTVQHKTESAARSSGNPAEIKVIPTHNQE
jgi:uncharacterized protein (TIGR02271 family)